MVHLSPRIIGSRTVDIQKSLQDITISAPHYYFDKTILIGKAARIAANIRGFNYLKPSQLDIMSVELGITPMEVRDAILPRLEEINVVRLIKGHTGKIERVEEKVPRVILLIEELGKYMRELEPSPIETSGIEALNIATMKPIKKTELKDRLTELNEEEFNILLDCGKTGRFLDEYIAPNGEVEIYSPLVWNERSEDVMKMYTSLSVTQKDELVHILDSINSYAGTPLETLQTSNQLLIGQAIRTGIIEKCSVTTKKGTKDYLFMPNPKFRIESEGVRQCDLFDKAKIILSCIRQGQHYAEITRILYPDKVLQKLLDRGYLKPHSEFKEQYALLELHGIARTEPAIGNRDYLKLIDTDENRQAIEAAIDVISHTREAVTARVVNTQARALLLSGNFINPARNRARIKELPQLTYKTLQNLMEKLREESIDE
jgi:hypothetical protein